MLPVHREHLHEQKIVLGDLVSKVLMNWWKLNPQFKNTHDNRDSVLRDTEGGLRSSEFCFDFFFFLLNLKIIPRI